MMLESTLHIGENMPPFGSANLINGIINLGKTFIGGAGAEVFIRSMTDDLNNMDCIEGNCEPPIVGQGELPIEIWEHFEIRKPVRPMPLLYNLAVEAWEKLQRLSKGLGQDRAQLTLPVLEIGFGNEITGDAIGELIRLLIDEMDKNTDPIRIKFGPLLTEEERLKMEYLETQQETYQMGKSIKELERKLGWRNHKMHGDLDELNGKWKGTTDIGERLRILYRAKTLMLMYKVALNYYFLQHRLYNPPQPPVPGPQPEPPIPGPQPGPYPDPNQDLIFQVPAIYGPLILHMLAR